MPCTITYKGKNYSEEEFKNYVQTMREFLSQIAEIYGIY